MGGFKGFIYRRWYMNERMPIDHLWKGTDKAKGARGGTDG